MTSSDIRDHATMTANHLRSHGYGLTDTTVDETILHVMDMMKATGRIVTTALIDSALWVNASEPAHVVIIPTDAEFNELPF
jgi:hypothetical protein